jgi:hypothetical protein
MSFLFNKALLQVSWWSALADLSRTTSQAALGLAGFQPLRTAIASDCGQWFQLIADSIATIADR